MNKNRLIITSVISIVLVSILMIGSTYSIFTSNDVDEDSNVYATGNLDITYTVDSESVTITEKESLAIEDANTVTPYRITVTNNGTVPYMFDLILDDTTTTDVIDYQYIMTKVGYLEPKSLGSCTDNIIKEGIILPAGESVDIDVRVWLDDSIQNTEIGKSFFAKLKVDGIAIYDKNETIDNSVLSLRYMQNASSNNFRNEKYLNYIKNVSIVDYIDTSNSSLDENNEIISWDMSVSQDNSVVAWVEDNETEGYYDLYIGANEMIYAKNLGTYFYNMLNVDSIILENLDTSLTTNMKQLFHNLGYNSTIFTLDLGENFDTSNVTNMWGMFNCTGRSSTVFTLDLGEKFNTLNVKDIRSMFMGTGYSSTVFTLDLGEKFDTSNVTSMSSMFNSTGYSSTEFTLDLGEKFDTSNVTEMGSMFANTGHSSTKFTLNLGEKFDTSNVTNMGSMFMGTGYSSTVFALDLGEKFDTSNVTEMSTMFASTGCSCPVFTLDLGKKFDTSNVTSMSQMFASVGKANSNLELDLSTFNFDKVTNYTDMFAGFTSTKKIYVANTTQQSWLLDKGFTNVTSDNVLLKTS